MNRVGEIIRRCAGGSVRRFAREVGIEPSTASRLKNGKAGASQTEGLGRFLERIYRAYPDLNAHWLLTGEGEMFKSQKTDKNIEEKLDEILEKIDFFTLHTAPFTSR